ncbi:MAG: RNA polymerase sigma factor [Planctomycetes bacterium]|nr:RNA polymerase sigma factor [Planctomycetota bacterium]
MAKSPDRILDELLVLKCQGGDVEALRKLVARWHGRLRRHAWYLTQDQEATGDVVQDAWLDIIRTIHRLKEPSSFRGWAYRIVGNKAAGWIRCRKRQRAIYTEVAQQKRDVTNWTPDESDNSEQSPVREGIRMLPAISQQILSLKYIDHMSTREISDALDIPLGTVKSRLHHARERLRQILQRNDL